jgi:hypothetical protein
VPNYLHATTYRGVQLQGHALFTSALDEDVWSASLPCRLTSEERATLPIVRILTAHSWLGLYSEDKNPLPLSETKSQLLGSAVAI